jgi:hypothetical protein
MNRVISAILVFLSLTSTTVLADPIKLGGSTLGINCGTAGVGTTLISAVSNVAGIIISTGVITGAGTNEQTVFEAIYPDGTTHVLWLLNVTNNAMNSTILPYPIFVPAGVALACVDSITGNGAVYLNYDLLAH